MERYLLIEILKDGTSNLVYTFFNPSEAEEACKDMCFKYPNRSFAIQTI